ncbi:MAG: hypothetical protein QOJ99_839 [Bryobacterales bacterium]|nr:hypothetical protein [Bryobacterales bacterium]
MQFRAGGGESCSPKLPNNSFGRTDRTGAGNDRLYPGRWSHWQDFAATMLGTGGDAEREYKVFMNSN